MSDDTLPATTPTVDPAPTRVRRSSVPTPAPSGSCEMSDEELLDLQMRQLDIRIEGSELEPRIEQLHEELAARGLTFRPHFWLSDEWFTPDGIPGIAIPFYLAHPRLAKLELAQMLEVEGGDPEWCMRILRHEAGHAIDNAFALRRQQAAARDLRQLARAVPRVLHAEAVQQELRAAPRRVVRAEPSRRGLRRDVRGVADARARSGEKRYTAGRR